MKRIELDAHAATLMAGLLANHINEQFVKPRTLHVDIPKELQLRYVEARTHAYAKYLLLYQDLGGRHGFPNRPGKVTFDPRPRELVDYTPENLAHAGV